MKQALDWVGLALMWDVGWGSLESWQPFYLSTQDFCFLPYNWPSQVIFIALSHNPISKATFSDGLNRKWRPWLFWPNLSWKNAWQIASLDLFNTTIQFTPHYGTYPNSVICGCQTKMERPLSFESRSPNQDHNAQVLPKAQKPTHTHDEELIVNPAEADTIGHNMK